MSERVRLPEALENLRDGAANFTAAVDRFKSVTEKPVVFLIEGLGNADQNFRFFLEQWLLEPVLRMDHTLVILGSFSEVNLTSAVLRRQRSAIAL